MYLISAIALFATAVYGFRDTSPFFLFSTSEIPFSSPHITTASSLTNSLTEQLKLCPSDIYIIAQQQAVSDADFTTGKELPHLRKWISKEDGIKTASTVASVKGTIKVSEIVEVLEKDCGAGTLHVDASTGFFNVLDEQKPRVIKITFPALPAGEGRAAALRNNDFFLASLIDSLPSQKFTVLLTTTPSSQKFEHVEEELPSYQMDTTMSPLVHMDLKRDADIHARSTNGTIKLVDGPLFERFQFFTPGIFMGLLTLFFLASILYVAISGIMGLQVSYAAFDKENGPAAQKKQQ